MPDATSTPSETGLTEALTASLGPIADMDLDACLKRKAALLGNNRSLDELSEDELVEFHSLCTRLRHINQPAGKPAAKSKKTVTTAESVADDFT